MISLYLPHDQVYSVLKLNMPSVCFFFGGGTLLLPMVLFIPQDINTALHLEKE